MGTKILRNTLQATTQDLSSLSNNYYRHARVVIILETGPVVNGRVDELSDALDGTLKEQK